MCSSVVGSIISNIKFNTECLGFLYTKLLEIEVYKKKQRCLRSVDVNHPLHKQKIFMLRPCLNFASVKEGFLECLNFTCYSKLCFQGKMTIPGYQFRASLQFMHRKVQIMLLKILTHSMTGCVTFCFDGSFVKCFQHVSSVIIPF